MQPLLKIKQPFGHKHLQHLLVIIIHIILDFFLIPFLAFYVFAVESMSFINEGHTSMNKSFYYY